MTVRQAFSLTAMWHANVNGGLESQCHRLSITYEGVLTRDRMDPAARWPSTKVESPPSIARLAKAEL
jgi:hypothetical protein